MLMIENKASYSISESGERKRVHINELSIKTIAMSNKGNRKNLYIERKIEWQIPIPIYISSGELDHFLFYTKAQAQAHAHSHSHSHSQYIMCNSIQD